MMPRLLIRDLALERWPSMDRYAVELATHVPDAFVPPEWRLHAGRRYFQRYWAYPRRLRRYGGRLVHVLDHAYAHCLRAFPDVPSVVTLHDLLPLDLVRTPPRGLRGLARNRLVAWSLEWLGEADRLIVTTAFMRDAAIERLSLARDRLRVIPMGVDLEFFGAPADGAARREGWRRALAREAAPRHVLLHVGSCAPRKNIEGAFGATAHLRRDGLDVVLVQIGGVFTREQRRLLERLDLGRAVVQEPSVDDVALRAAYQAADVLVIPSTYEGFGMPVLEAMASGLPVVTSGAGGLAEACGSAAWVTGDSGEESLAAAVATLLSDPVRYEELREAGTERAHAYAWERIARDTLAVYAEIEDS